MKHPLDRSPDSTRGFAFAELAISVGVESRWIALKTHGWRAITVPTSTSGKGLVRRDRKPNRVGPPVRVKIDLTRSTWRMGSGAASEVGPSNSKSRLRAPILHGFPSIVAKP